LKITGSRRKPIGKKVAVKAPLVSKDGLDFVFKNFPWLRGKETREGENGLGRSIEIPASRLCFHLCETSRNLLKSAPIKREKPGNEKC